MAQSAAASVPAETAAVSSTQVVQPLVNVRDLLSMPTDQVERPRPLPIGHYYATILGHGLDKSSVKQTAFVRFNLKVEGPAEDVDPDAVKDFDFSRREMRKDYYLTPIAIFRLTDALNAVQGEQVGRSFDERLPEMRGQRVLIQVTQRQSQDGSETYNDIGRMLAAA